MDTINYIDSVKIIWPDNQDEVFYGINVNNKNILIRGNGSLMGKLNQASPTTSNFSIKNIYPNPFNAETTVSIQAHENIRPTLQLFDLKGNLLKENIYELRGNKNHFIRLSLET